MPLSYFLMSQFNIQMSQSNILMSQCNILMSQCNILMSQYNILMSQCNIRIKFRHFWNSYVIFQIQTFFRNLDTPKHSQIQIVTFLKKITPPHIGHCQKNLHFFSDTSHQGCIKPVYVVSRIPDKLLTVRKMTKEITTKKVGPNIVT